MSEEGVRQWLKDYEFCGKLKPGNGGGTSFLSEEQTAAPLADLDEKPYVKVSRFALTRMGYAAFAIRCGA